MQRTHYIDTHTFIHMITRLLFNVRQSNQRIHLIAPLAFAISSSTGVETRQQS